MTLFTPPLPDFAHSYLSGNNSRKRKRIRATSDSHSDEQSIATYNTNKNVSAASTNPLSLAPDEIAQYRLAGLSLDEELPSQKGLLDWPHRALKSTQNDFFPPSRSANAKIKVKGRESIDATEDEDGEQTDRRTVNRSRAPHGHHLRLQHLHVLTAIVHRCLLEGDIPRATRAYSLLLRAEVGGHPVDLKSTGYWGIGAELLARSAEQAKSNKFNYISNTDSEPDEEETNNEVPQFQGDLDDKEKEWGSKSGRENAKSYYETLIVQYPYKKQYHNYYSSLSFWPAMAACEIYGIQYEQRESLRKLSRENGDGSDSSEADNGEDEIYEDEHSNLASSVAPALSKERSRQYRRTEKLWTRKDDIRIAALTASEALASRMDEIMNKPPFDRDVSMLRLRGMIALYIGDLNLPLKPDEIGQEADRDRRFLFMTRTNAYERGKDKKREHWAKAKLLFEKSAREGGDKIHFETVEEDADGDDSEEHDYEETLKESREPSYDESWR
ncbi:hypothetical protein HYFRA_00001144 [Hymenoscyphus fraxineus]|uniref:Uncharacterized protein n=1 Tax=Hymenoscyphus fraxineus TaxID=746836 RepID=A0A9N9KUS4_9HELO|nr:hypothetical protein HYFRA_00001144 [Hymenoscyphus fraxineus]